MQQNLLPLCLPLLLDPSITGTLQNQTINTEVSSGLAAGFQLWQNGKLFFHCVIHNKLHKKKKKENSYEGWISRFSLAVFAKVPRKKMQNFILHWHQVNKVNQTFNYTGKKKKKKKVVCAVPPSLHPEGPLLYQDFLPAEHVISFSSVLPPGDPLRKVD